MKKIVLPLIFCFGIISVSAQSSSKSETKIATILTGKITTNLSLNTYQEDLVYKINLDAAYKLSALKKQKKTEQEYFAEKKEIENLKRTDIMEVLNAKQKSNFQKDNAKYDAKIAKQSKTVKS